MASDGDNIDKHNYLWSMEKMDSTDVSGDNSLQSAKIQDIMNYWADINECSKSESGNLPDRDKNDNSYASIDKNTECFKNHQVWLYTIHGGGHTWPGAWGNMDINASQEIWKFFSRYLE